MPEPLDSKLEALNTTLRLFGKYEEANAVSLLTRLCRIHGVDSLEKLEAFVDQENADANAAQALIDAVTP